MVEPVKGRAERRGGGIKGISCMGTVRQATCMRMRQLSALSFNLRSGRRSHLAEDLKLDRYSCSVEKRKDEDGNHDPVAMDPRAGSAPLRLRIRSRIALTSQGKDVSTMGAYPSSQFSHPSPSACSSDPRRAATSPRQRRLPRARLPPAGMGGSEGRGRRGCWWEQW